MVEYVDIQGSAHEGCVCDVSGRYYSNHGSGCLTRSTNMFVWLAWWQPRSGEDRSQGQKPPGLRLNDSRHEWIHGGRSWEKIGAAGGHGGDTSWRFLNLDTVPTKDRYNRGPHLGDGVCVLYLE